MTVRCNKFMRPLGAKQELSAQAKFQCSTKLGLHSTYANMAFVFAPQQKQLLHLSPLDKSCGSEYGALELGDALARNCRSCGNSRPPGALFPATLAPLSLRVAHPSRRIAQPSRFLHRSDIQRNRCLVLWLERPNSSRVDRLSKYQGRAHEGSQFHGMRDAWNSSG